MLKVPQLFTPLAPPAPELKPSGAPATCPCDSLPLTDTIGEPNAASADEVLVRECRRGREEAWSALVDKYRNLIFSIPIRCGISRQEANEIFQEVCLKLLSHLHQLREPRSLAGWLIQLTFHECSRWHRKQFRNGMESLDANEVEVAAPLETGESILNELRRQQTLHEAVEQLPPRCRCLIHMLFFTTPAIPYDQVAKTLGIAKGSVGFIRMRCLERLRRGLQEKGFMCESSIRCGSGRGCPPRTVLRDRK
ncbi:MAG: sigma-70 family RNA polymerase sigma factor [Bryobacterales bacterium]|nr:sigma-70 family RNA polymerase sigma factor [Bryobacterales bacterium]MBV9399618.1 sigma-70 family RNA polymerase sigma factor [Bryobacterales bacterium]